MRCIDCPFYYKGENDRFSCCHFERRTFYDVPPCEVDENEWEEESNYWEELTEDYSDL